MKLFAGLEKTDYQDILRAVGLLLDQQKLRDLRMWEQEDGLVIQGRRFDDDAGVYETILLTDDDLQVILERAYKRRNHQPEVRTGF